VAVLRFLLFCLISAPHVWAQKNENHKPSSSGSSAFCSVLTPAGPCYFDNKTYYYHYLHEFIPGWLDRKAAILQEKERTEMKTMGGVKSKKPWVLQSPYRNSKNFYMFKFYPAELPYLILQGHHKEYKWVLSSDKTFKIQHRLLHTDIIETLDLSYIRSTQKGEAYDKEGRLLEPVRYLTEDLSPFYVWKNKTLIQEDIDNYRKGKGKRGGKIAGYVLNGFFTFGVVGKYLDYRYDKGIEPNPYLFGSLLGVNVALYGVIWWFTRDTHSYNYPHHP
jgi:hypothetical protein